MNSEPPSNPASSPRRRTLWRKIIASKFLFVSIVVHLLFGAGATLYVVQRIQRDRKLVFRPDPPSTIRSSRPLEQEAARVKKKNAPNAPAQARRIASIAVSKIPLPEMAKVETVSRFIPTRQSGMGLDGSGNGLIGTGKDRGPSMGPIIAPPPSMGERCSPASRAQAMRLNGGDPKAEEAIKKGLDWLKAHQNDDGSFGEQYPVAMTGLALLSYLGHCEKPTSTDYGKTVRQAIDFLLGVGTAQDGKLAKTGGTPWVYEHGIATYALGEAYILTKDQKIAEVFTKAVRLIVEGQGPDGGWMYNYDKSASDTSVSGWQVQALKTAVLSGLNISGAELAMKNSVANTMRCQGSNGGFGYRGPEDKQSLTGVGIVMLQIASHERVQPVRKALSFYIDGKGAPTYNYDAGDANLYSWYYGAQACFQFGGSPWGKWNRTVMPQIISHQSEDGSWRPLGGAGGTGFDHTGKGTTKDAQAYRTALCCLTLEVYYRYLAASR